MWKCANCGELIEDTFDVCWSCGTDEDGVRDPHFQSEAATVAIPEEELPSGPRPWRFSMRTLLLLVTLLMVFLAVLGPRGEKVAQWTTAIVIAIGMGMFVGLVVNLLHRWSNRRVPSDNETDGGRP